MDLMVIAESAYNAYGEATGRKNYQGLPMPAWEDLPPSIQNAWVQAVKNARSYG